MVLLKIYKKVPIIFLLIFLLSFINCTNIKGAEDINIISSTEVTASRAKAWAESKGATDTFIALADLYWKYSSSCGDVNPAVAYAQAALETGYGRFGDNLDETWKNPCGDYDANAHKKFASWSEGVQAPLDHLALYAGVNGYPKKHTYDTRHFSNLLGKCKTVVSLGGNWAPSKDYGDTVLKLYSEILKTNKDYTGNACIKDGCKEDEDIYENIGTIDVPLKESSGNKLIVSGWALSKSGISDVKIAINNKDIGKANVKLKVTFYCKDGSQFNVEKDVFINKQGLIMNLECPINNESINDEDLVIKGWTLCKEKIQDINIYINDELIGKANYGIKKSNVISKHKDYDNVNCGFSAIISLKNKKAGTLKLKIESVSKSGISTYKEVSICNYYKNKDDLDFNNKVVNNVIKLNKEETTIKIK